MNKPTTPSPGDMLRVMGATSPPSMRASLNELQRLTKEVNESTDRIQGTLIVALNTNSVSDLTTARAAEIAARALKSRPER